jgi:iron complex outermembrane receptor protein
MMGWRAALLASATMLPWIPGMARSAEPQAQLAQTGMQPQAWRIPPQPLLTALTSFADQAGLRLFFASDEVAGLRSPGVTGSLSTEEALTQLLAGTGYTWRSTRTGSITLERLPTQGSGTVQLPTVTVTGRNGALSAPYAGGQVAEGGGLGMLGRRGVMDTPFNQTSYTDTLIADQQARSVADVTRNDASVRSTWADGSYSNQFFIRGFPMANSDISVNGLYGLVPYQMAGTSWVERLEVLKGPSALLSGVPPQGSIGGAINLVTKRAGDEPLTRLTLGYVSDSQFGPRVDLSRRFGEDKQWGIRFNGAYSNGDAAGDHQSSEMVETMLGVDYRGERLRLSADLGHQEIHGNNPSRPVYARAGFQIPRAPSASADLGQSYYYADGEDTFGLFRAEYDITDDLTAYVTGGARRNDFRGLYNFTYIRNRAGDTDANVYFQPTYAESYTGETGLRGRFVTGPVRHEVTLSATRLVNELGAMAPVVQTYTGNLYTTTDAVFPNLAGRARSSPRTSEAHFTSYALADTLSVLDDRLQLILGLRHQQVEQRSWNATTGLRTASYDESAVTPAFGLVVKPWSNVSLYANYIEGLSQGPTAPTNARNVGEAFAPIRSRQYEVGAKWDLGSVLTTLSLFQIEQPSGMLNTATGLYGVDGETRNRGIELNAFGEALPGLRVLAGIALMDGEQTKTAGGATDGRKAVGVPSVQMNAGLDWDVSFLPGLSLGGRVIHTAKQYASADNSQSIPDWTRMDLGARYTFLRNGNKPVTVRATVENVFNDSYWAAASSSFGLARGAPRTVLLSTSFDF